jgi:hypothetical protein
MSDQSSRPEGAFVLMLMQSTFWVIAGISAFPFVLAGEVFEAALGAASFALAAFGCLLAVGLVRRRRRARRWAIALETVCLAFSALLLAVPLGANRGPVSLMVNIALPVAVIALLRGRKMRAAFSQEAVDRAPIEPASVSEEQGLRQQSRPDAS